LFNASEACYVCLFFLKHDREERPRRRTNR